MNCNNYFDMTDQGDSFETWQGLRGPAGPQGTPGAPGSSVELKGPVATTGDLPASAPANELWQVGTESPYNGYFYNGTSWISLGPVAAGTTFTPTVSSAGVISWTNDGGLPNPEPVNIKGPQGPAGADGSDGVTFTPAVSSAGVISWTNDGSLPNPEPVNIKGPQGQTGPAGPGVPSGGSTGQVLKKQSATDYDTAWETEDLGITGASVGDLVRISAVDANNKPTAFTKAPLNAIKCNRNLLDNWYFVGGGSQLGYGVFPINQRGQTSYSNIEYSIDRWKKESNDGSVVIAANGVTISGQTARYIAQPVNGHNIYGKTITISALFTDGTLVAGSGILPVDAVSQRVSIPAPTYDNTIVSCYKTPQNKCAVQIFTNKPGDVTLAAIKLELGSTQTLAHQGNGVWVLNEIPNYSEELTKCRRYYRRYVSNSVYDFCLNGCLTNSKTHLLLGLHDGTPMVIRNPRATISGSVIVRGINGYIANPSEESVVIANTGYSDGYGTTLAIQKSTAEAWTDDDINNTPIQVNLPTGTIIEIYAE